MNFKFYLKTLLALSVMTLTISGLSAQGINVKGKVLEANGSPVIGATVSVKGTSTGQTVDINGSYSINVPNAEATLIFMSLGYETQEIVVGNRTTIDVTLKETATQIESVVVTALGLTREEKSLGYAVTKIDGDVLTSTVSSNWLNSLSGKVAGLNFDGASSGPGGTMRVTLRGEGSLSHDNNEALFVIDGIPISTPKIISGKSSYDDLEAPVDFGNSISDINPDDIESISVLKGPSATALYGSRAANGAIIITTKKGRATKGIGVTVSSSVVFERAGFWPDLQSEYGAGNGGAWHDDLNDYVQQYYYSFWNIGTPGMTTDGGTTPGRLQSRYAWGPRYEGQMFYQYEGYDWETGLYTATPWRAQDWYKGFFQTGVTYTNSVSVDGNLGEGTTFRMSVKDTRNEWIAPNTGYNSQNVSLNFAAKLNKYIKASGSVTYHRRNSDNLPSTGYSQASPLYALTWNVASVGIDKYKREYDMGYIQRQHALVEAGSESEGQKLINNATGNARSENVYWLINESVNTLDRDRAYGNLSIEAQILPKLSLMLRSGVDLSNDFRTSRKPQYSYEYKQGWYREHTSTMFEMNNDFLLSYNDVFLDDDLTMSASFGGNNMVYNFRSTKETALRLKVPNRFLLSNSDGDVLTDPQRSNKSVNSFYGVVSLGWRDMLFLDITGRNDWSSTLARGNWSYFYPSVSASVLINEIFDFREKAPWVNMLKVRASWANVGNDTNPYEILFKYTAGTFTGSQVLPSTKPNATIKPENVESWEAGIEAKLFSNKWTFDVAVYDAKTTNQIIPVPLDYMTGARYQLINAGLVRNKGVEISTRIQLLQRGDINWSMSANWTKNWNKLEKLAPGVDLWQMNTNTLGSRVWIYAYPGQELGRIYGFGYQRAPAGSYYIENGEMIDCSGQVIVDENGYPVIDTENLKDFGSIYPAWKAGMSHSFSWRNLSFSATFTGQWGGSAYSLTAQELSNQGKTKNTLAGRYDGLVHEGVNLLSDGSYTKNTTVTANVVEYYMNSIYNRDNVEENTYKTSFLKFKEARLDYSLPQRWMDKVKGFQGASIGFFVTNIFCITNFPQYDPEVAAMNNGSISRGIESGAYPMTRTYGINVKLNF